MTRSLMMAALVAFGFNAFATETTTTTTDKTTTQKSATEGAGAPNTGAAAKPHATEPTGKTLGYKEAKAACLQEKPELKGKDLRTCVTEKQVAAKGGAATTTK